MLLSDTSPELSILCRKSQTSLGICKNKDAIVKFTLCGHAIRCWCCVDGQSLTASR